MKSISKLLFWAAVVAGVTLISLLPSQWGAFLYWDDQALLIQNGCYRGLDASHWKWMCTTFLLGHWQPVSWLSYALDYTMWGLNPQGWHMTNLLIHTINAVLVYLLCLAFLKERSGRYAAAALAALFWAVHPLRVEAVAWLSTRGYLLCGTFSLLTVLFYLKFGGTRSVASDSCGHDRAWPSRVFYLAALLCFALATFTKGIGMMLPLVLLIMDWIPFRRIISWRTAFPCAVEKAPFFLLSLIGGTMAFFAKQNSGGMSSLEDHGLWARIGQAVCNFWFYLWKTAVPANLSPLYYKLPGMGVSAALLLSAILLFLLAFLWRRSRPWLLVSLSAYGLLVFPMLGITQSGLQVAADRFTYLSTLPFAVLAGCALVRLQAFRRTCFLLSWVLVFLFCIQSVGQTLIWQNDMNLWKQATRLAPLDIEANQNLAAASLKLHRPEEGVLAMQHAIECAARAGNADAETAACNSLGLIYFKIGRPDAALATYSRAIELKPDSQGGSFALHNRALLYQAMGQTGKALNDLNIALKNPKLKEIDRGERLLLRAKIRMETGDPAGAEADCAAIAPEVRSKIAERLLQKNRE